MHPYCIFVMQKWIENVFNRCRFFQDKFFVFFISANKIERPNWYETILYEKRHDAFIFHSFMWKSVHGQNCAESNFHRSLQKKCSGVQAQLVQGRKAEALIPVAQLFSGQSQENAVRHGSSRRGAEHPAPMPCLLRDQGRTMRPQRRPRVLAPSRPVPR